jgi:hypothetical protein
MGRSDYFRFLIPSSSEESCSLLDPITISNHPLRCSTFSILTSSSNLSSSDFTSSVSALNSFSGGSLWGDRRFRLGASGGGGDVGDALLRRR